MAFSHGMKDMGKFQFYKVFHLIEIILKIYYYRICKGVAIMYYPPSGPNSAVIRDLMILFTTRWMFKKTIFHFHASGLSEHLKKKNKLFLYIFRKSFFFPDISIQLSGSCPNEGGKICARNVIIVPNGLPDEAHTPNVQQAKKVLNVLFVGLLEESKGEMVLCQALNILKKKGVLCRARIAGDFKSIEYRKKFFDYIMQNQLNDEIDYIGVIRGDAKEKAFRESDVFCFPSYFHSESFPLVLIEAMSYGLPIVSTYWRGIVDMVEDGFNGYLTGVKSPEEVADKLELLAKDVALRKEIGMNSRRLFEEKYDIRQHLRMMNDVFQNI